MTMMAVPARPADLRRVTDAVEESLRVARAIAAGVREEGRLTDLVFRARHPERRGRPLNPAEPGFAALRDEWWNIRRIVVRPILWAAVRAAVRRVALGEYTWWEFGTRHESDPRVRPRLVDYWRATPGVPPGGSALWTTPWSAAFISYVLRTAGAGPAFRYSRAHLVYVHRAIRNVRSDPGQPVQAFPVDRVTPRIGDLVCNWRNGRPISYADLAAAAVPPAAHPLHCDVVTAVRPDMVEVIGGNKGAGTVGRERHRLRNGRLVPLSGGRRGWLAVVRLGP